MLNSEQTHDGYGGLPRDPNRVDHYAVHELKADEYADAVLSSPMPSLAGGSRRYELIYSSHALVELIHSLTKVGAPFESIEQVRSTLEWVRSEIAKEDLD